MDLRGLFARLPIPGLKNPPPVVGVLRLSGVIGSLGPLRSGMTLAALEPAINRAFELPRLAAVALSVNSPGGSATQSDLIARRIRDLAAEKEVPVLVFCEDVAASGGYWLACAGDEIYLRETSIVGSIGVISAGFGFPALLDKIGVERRLHTAGERKSLLDPFRPEDPGDVERLKGVQQDIHEAFKETVRQRRGDRLKAEETELFSGEFWVGRKAIERGLADGFGELRQVLRARYGEKVVLKRVDGRRPWWRRRLGLGTAADQRAGMAADWFGGALAAVEERALWSRFGL